MRIITFLLLSLATFTAVAQMTVDGFVYDTKTGLPLVYANIYLKGKPDIGTITNAEGIFRLIIPNPVSDIVIISYMGYDDALINTGDIRQDTRLRIALAEKETVLHEVIVMPEDGLLNLLKKAYSKIITNYPNNGTLIKGFYRETNKLIPENKYLYFAESLIEFYKPDYSNKQYGSVRIITGNKTELESRLKYSNVYYYAGLYSAQRFDFVKQKIDFINPKHFAEYNYQIAGKTINDNKEVYIIRFSPRKNGLYEGEFYLDKESLVYIGADYKLSQHGIQRRNSIINIKGLEQQGSRYLIKYRYINNSWNIHVVLYEGIVNNKKYKNTIRYTSEFVGTSYESMESNPIKESEAVAFTAIYSEQEDKFSEEFWKNPEILSRTEELERTIEMLNKRSEVRTDQREVYYNFEDSVKRKLKFKKGLIKLALKISSGLSLSTAPVKTKGGVFNLTYPNYFSIQKEVLPQTYITTINYDLAYHISRSTSIVFGSSGNINPKTFFSLTALGFEWSKRILGWKRPLYIQPGVSLYYLTAGSNLGRVGSTRDFKIHNTIIDANKVDLSIGEVRKGIMPSVQLAYKFKPKWSVYSKISASFVSSSSDKIFVREASGFFLSRKSVNLDIDKNQMILTKDDVIQQNSNTYTQEYNLFFGLGIRFGLK